jgi:hypothetical protein
MTLSTSRVRCRSNWIASGGAATAVEMESTVDVSMGAGGHAGCLSIPSSPEEYIEQSLKRVRLGSTPGELRLKQDWQQFRKRILVDNAQSHCGPNPLEDEVSWHATARDRQSTTDDHHHHNVFHDRSHLSLVGSNQARLRLYFRRDYSQRHGQVLNAETMIVVSLQFPKWFPHHAPEVVRIVAVDYIHGESVRTCPQDYPFRMKFRTTPESPATSQDKSVILLPWSPLCSLTDVVNSITSAIATTAAEALSHIDSMEIGAKEIVDKLLKRPPLATFLPSGSQLSMTCEHQSSSSHVTATAHSGETAHTGCESRENVMTDAEIEYLDNGLVDRSHGLPPRDVVAAFAPNRFERGYSKTKTARKALNPGNIIAGQNECNAPIDTMDNDFMLLD